MEKKIFNLFIIWEIIEKEKKYKIMIFFLFIFKGEINYFSFRRILLLHKIKWFNTLIMVIGEIWICKIGLIICFEGVYLIIIEYLFRIFF
jgi:hypothetical protein